MYVLAFLTLMHLPLLAIVPSTCGLWKVTLCTELIFMCGLHCLLMCQL